MQLIKAVLTDLDQFAHTAALAYNADPLQQWIMKNVRSKEKANIEFFKLFLRPGIEQGKIFTEPKKRGFIFWQSANQNNATSEGAFKLYLRLLVLLGWRTKKILTELERLAEMQPTQCHYLQAISVHPSHQQLGIGKQLFNTLLSLSEYKGTPVYCETASDKSLKFYQSLGFKITAQHQVKDGPKVWLLVLR